MMIDEATEKQLSAWFRPLNSVGAAKAFPARSTLSHALGRLLPPVVPAQRNVNDKLASQFMTAAVDIWLRGVHSFLVSAALTSASPIWASVSGYYSSHYAVRGLAHLLGHFQMFRKKRVAHLMTGAGGFSCMFTSKEAGDHEHKLYWKLVNASDQFKDNGLFTENLADSNISDIAHRNYANYADHLGIYPMFEPLNEQILKDRIDHITKIEFDTPPLPRLDEFPDVEYVQLIAYHRIVAFRTLLDEVHGGKNKFWNVHRNPSFAREYMNFQLAQGDALARYKN
jgi:hypothetical protein